MLLAFLNLAPGEARTHNLGIALLRTALQVPQADRLHHWSWGLKCELPNCMFFSMTYRSNYSINFLLKDYSHLIFNGSFILSHELCSYWNASHPLKTLLQVRLELTTSTMLCCVLPYKHRKLTDCTTGAEILNVNYRTACSLVRLIVQII